MAIADLNILADRPYIIKDRGFCPNPIALRGIPEYADSLANKKVIGTPAWTEFWEEQLDRCLNGYYTGGMWIPGRYYFYLNFCYMVTVGRGYHLPDYVDTDYYYFRLVEEIKAATDITGMITLKARRRGLSEKWAKGIGGYGLRFTPEKYKCAIAAGHSKYTDNLFAKIKEMNSKLPPEFRLLFTINNSETLIYDYVDDQGIECGSGNMVTVATMNKNPNALKSNYLNDVAFEEAGEFDELIPGFGATRDSLTVGNKIVGSAYVFGTGGNIKSQSKGFCDMWYKAEEFGLVKLEVYGQHLMIRHFIGSRNEVGKIEEVCPNIVAANPGLAKEQLLGCEDVGEALEIIKDKKTELSLSHERQKYYDYLQNMPTNQREAFLKFSGNPFNPEKLSFQSHQILINETKYRKYSMDWVRDKFGSPIVPLQIGEVKELPNETPDDQAILILDGPRAGFSGLDVAGIDSYDLDQTATSKSLGAMVVKRRNHMGAPFTNYIVCLIRMRPARKEIFYENCLKVAVYYNLLGNTLIDVRCPMIIEYFKNNQGRKYLAKRPQSFESEYSEQMHEFGVAMTERSKPQMLAGVQTYVEDDCDKIWFPQVIAETADYDVTTKDVDSDWDTTDALGFALMQEKNLITLHRFVQEDNKQQVEDPFDLSTPGMDYDNQNPVGGTHYYKNGKEITDLMTKFLINQEGVM